MFKYLPTFWDICIVCVFLIFQKILISIRSVKMFLHDADTDIALHQDLVSQLSKPSCFRNKQKFLSMG